ncbi:hypothetical protein [Streptomyces sp. NRRL WC-3742]|uniref:hypothetical protein n=1 Tax=Streptomyces sp. NRRL WC-3742 TaxID=1463934 RepID=UPI000689E45B|nr:hypothetical protein [Streptomyces sp. NRRL WC-3742]
MLTKAPLQGYLLEEALARLLRNSGYRLLSHTGDDRAELTTSQDGSLAVRGRGARHQVDVLGQFAFTPAFSLPVRMFLEAKSYNERCGLSIVRNAHGVVRDINQNFALPELRNPASSDHGTARPRRRYHYVYVLFSTSGFTKDAQRFALAHQISLVDLSGESFKWLRDRIGTAADLLYTISTQNGITKFPVSWLRAVLRNELKTAEISEPSDISTNAPQFTAVALPVVEGFAHKLTEKLNGGQGVAGSNPVVPTSVYAGRRPFPLRGGSGLDVFSGPCECIVRAGFRPSRARQGARCLNSPSVAGPW